MLRTPALAALLVCSAPAFAGPLTNALIYQGQLQDNAAPANGAYDLQFRLYDALSPGAQVGPTLCVNDVAVTNGLFTVELNFGAGDPSEARRPRMTLQFFPTSCGTVDVENP